MIHYVFAIEPSPVTEHRIFEFAYTMIHLLHSFQEVEKVGAYKLEVIGSMILSLLVPRYEKALEGDGEDEVVSGSEKERDLLLGVFGPTLTEIASSQSRRRKNKRMEKAKADHVTTLTCTENKHGEDLVFNILREGLVWSNDDEASLARAFAHLAEVHLSPSLFLFPPLLINGICPYVDEPLAGVC